MTDPGLDEPIEDLAFLTRWLRTTHGGTLSGRRIEALAAAVRADERAKVAEERDRLRDKVEAVRAATWDAAREAVARQTDLTELVHFDRPSDFRKGVLSSLVALDEARKEAEK